ncbi:hypothetical protein [Methylobacterium sp. GC_Met_2]|uniref:hypothetical protein n=1 Tax=Methylobacterium sp. GC_Met_2 TaxID=2937376 RepID=UPI00226B5816|nr:hypothetical protein [Methylobacterium sp. GC_Met_2]
MAVLIDRTLERGAATWVDQTVARMMRHLIHEVGPIIMAPFECNAVHEAMTL